MFITFGQPISLESFSGWKKRETILVGLQLLFILQDILPCFQTRKKLMNKLGCLVICKGQNNLNILYFVFSEVEKKKVNSIPLIAFCFNSNQMAWKDFLFYSISSFHSIFPHIIYSFSYIRVSVYDM